MDVAASPLVLTKLRVPAPRPRQIPRAHLVERLAPGAGADVILVCAPAGYGKTTLLAEWAHALWGAGTAVAWLAIDPGDDDASTFGRYLVASLAQALGPNAELARIAQLLRASPYLELQTVLPALLNTLAAGDRPCVLILDDYHLIGAPAIHAALAFFLERLPGNMRVALGSRSDPPFPLARWRARGRLLELRAGDLRFTSPEAARFLREVMRLEVSAADTATLEARTEGWAAGLQLAGLSLAQRAGRADAESAVSRSTAGQRFLADYLLEEVLSRQPQRVQSFLLATSILDRLCAPLCDAVWDRLEDRPKRPAASPSPSSAILDDLERANLFLIPLDDARQWFRYHHLFRDFLQQQLAKTPPGTAAALHRAASEWYSANDLLREAVQHALQTEEWDYAAACVERHGFTLIAHGELAALSGWCAAFPEEVLRTHPTLGLLQGWALVLRLRRRDRERIETRLAQVEQAAGALENAEQARALVEHAAVVRSYLVMVPDPAIDPRAQLALARRLQGAQPQEDSGQLSAWLMIGYAHMALHDAAAAAQAMEAARQAALRGRLYAGVVEATFHLMRLAATQSDLQRAVGLYEQGRGDLAGTIGPAAQALPAAGCLDIALGAALVEQGRPREAEQALLAGLERGGWGMPHYYLMTACLALHRLYEGQGRSAEALDFLARLDDAWPDVDFCTRGLRALSALRAAPGEGAARAEAENWCREFAGLLGDAAPPPGMGPLGAAEAFYQGSLAWVRAQLALGHAGAVLPYLTRQLGCAVPQGLKSRVEELSLLETQARQAAGAQPVAAGRPAPGLIAGSGESLTERELQVLRLMAQGATNGEIAAQLVITVGTVKSHINHVLGKLNARNRTEAVARARERGWLDR